MEGTKKPINWEPINFVFYLNFVKWPVLAAIAVEIILRLVFLNFFDDILSDKVDLLMWAVRLAVFIFIGRQIAKTYGEVPQLGALSGLMAGGVIGLAVALFRFYESFHAWKIFNLLTETTLTAIVGCLIVGLVVYIWDLLPVIKK